MSTDTDSEPHSHAYARTLLNVYLTNGDGSLKTFTREQILNIVKTSYEAGANKALSRITEEFAASSEAIAV